VCKLLWGLLRRPIVHLHLVVQNKLKKKTVGRPKCAAALENLVRQAATLPKKPVIIYLSHCSVADFDTRVWRKGGWPWVNVSGSLGAKYRCASEETANELRGRGLHSPTSLVKLSHFCH